MDGPHVRRSITFSSDYGYADEFVGVCHAVIAAIAPGVRVVDITHELADVRSGAAVLAQSLTYASPAVHLAVVDPGVGTGRRGVVVSTADGSLLVGPDNGLLIPASEALGGTTDVYELADPRFRLPAVSATFHGRDIFAPAAAHLAAGLPPELVGPPVFDVVEPVPVAAPEVGEGRLAAEVLRSDRFGNLQLAAGRDDLLGAGLRGEVTVAAGSSRRKASVARTFGDVPEGALVVYLDSADHVAVACNGASACEVLGGPRRIRISRRRRRTGSGRTLQRDSEPRR